MDWDAERNMALPVAQVIFSQKPDSAYSVIPTVFITNDCMRRLDTAAASALAVNMTELIRKTAENRGIKNIPEVQVDCDWTASTMSVYFHLLRKIKEQSWLKGRQLSATIRLYQLKYVSKTGVPPVDKGLLMCYNMGNLKNPATANSVLEPAELKKYIAALADYTLPMDIALPLFEWKVLFRKQAFAGLIESLPDDSLSGRDFIKTNSNRYLFQKDAVINGYTFYAGDELRNEQSNYPDIISSALLVNRYLKNTRTTVSLYHLDSVILKKYSSHELETVFSSFD